MKLFRVDFLSGGKKHNYAVNLSAHEAIMMAKSLLVDDGYAGGLKVGSVSIERHFEYIATRRFQLLEAWCEQNA